MRVATRYNGKFTDIRALCHSAFVRVATLRMSARPKFHFFATAHSCGLRHEALRIVNNIVHLCHSAFVRVATAVLVNVHACDDLCHSAFVRVATLREDRRSPRAALCHSAFVRVATFGVLDTPTPEDLCHSAFVRVATPQPQPQPPLPHFATAHSCGLRLKEAKMIKDWLALPQRIRAGCDCGKAMQRTANLLREGR